MVPDTLFTSSSFFMLFLQILFLLLSNSPIQLGLPLRRLVGEQETSLFAFVFPIQN